MILFKEKQRLLIEQLLMFPKGDHDDLPDALEMAIRGLQIGTSKPQALKVDIIGKWFKSLWGD